MADSLPYLPAVETHLIESRHVLQSYRLQVLQPVQLPGESTRFPVIYAADANLTFDLLKSLTYLLQPPEGNGARFILVGIGYPGDSPFAGSVLRARDLTFPSYPRLRPAPRVQGVLLPPAAGPDFHGAEQFQRCIEQELIPYIEARYPVLPENRSYFGHSAAGGFGLFTLFTRGRLFDNYILSSPGLLFDGRSSAGICYDNYDFALQEARKFIAATTALPGLKLHLSVGAEEEYEPVRAQWQLTSSFHRLVALLRAANIDGLQLMSEVFPAETHMTALPLAFMHGVQAVLGSSRCDLSGH